MLYSNGRKDISNQCNPNKFNEFGNHLGNQITFKKIIFLSLYLSHYIKFILLFLWICFVCWIGMFKKGDLFERNKNALIFRKYVIEDSLTCG